MSGSAVRRPPAHLLEPTFGLGRRLCLLGATVISCLAVLLGAPALANASNPPSLSVRGAILIEESTGQDLYGYAANRELGDAQRELQQASALRVYEDPADLLAHIYELGGGR